MNRLHLEVDELKIESFETAARTKELEPAQFITQGAQTCYHCTRWGCPATGLC